MEANFDFTFPIQIGRGRMKLTRNQNTHTPEQKNLKLLVENMTEEQLEQALETIISDPNKTTIVDKNGNNHNNIETELTEYENNEQSIRRFTRIRSANPLVRLGKPITH